MAKTILTIFFLLLWLPVAAMMQGNASFSPPLRDATRLFGPVAWQVTGKTIARHGRWPEFRIYGQVESGDKPQQVILTTDFREWARLRRGTGTTTNLLFATALPHRPFVTAEGLAQDDSLRFHLGPLRMNAMFPFWALLAAALPALFYFWLHTAPDYVLSPQERWRQDESFRQRVRDLEIDYKDKPQKLRTRTLLLAFLGYGVVWGSIALMTAVGAGLAVAVMALTQEKYIAASVALVPALFTVKLARSLLSPRGGDSGVQLTVREAPDLFALLDKMRDKAQGPPFMRVFVNMEMNAGVSRHTGLCGLFGFGPVTLTLGLPLMQALPRLQLAAVIGHEYGHVAARDNALGQWIYRIRYSWLYLGDRLKTERLWYALRLNLFYRWFIGVFNAYSFTQSRHCEYGADAFAAKMAGARHIIDALVAMEVRSGLIRKNFWDDVWKKAGHAPEPSATPYQKMGAFLKAAVDGPDTLAEATAAATGHASTHPALADRIRALGGVISAPEPLTVSAATALLGAGFEAQLGMLFDKVWQEQNRDIWRIKYMERQAALATLDQMKGRPMTGLARDELSRLITAATVMQDDRAIVEACREIVRREPDNTTAQVHLLGFRLVNDNDESALIKLDDMAGSHPEQAPVAYRFAIRYFTRHGRAEEAAVYQFRLDEWSYRQQAADEERRHIFATDVFLPHGIAAAHVKKLAGCLRHPAIGRAYLVRKQVAYMTEKPAFVIGLRPRLLRLKHRKAAMDAVQQALAQSDLPPFFQIFWIGDVGGLEARLKKVAGSKIYAG